MKKLLFVPLVSLLFGFGEYHHSKAKLQNQDVMSKMKWIDYNTLLHHDFKFDDSLLKSHDFKYSDPSTYTFSDPNGLLITLTMENSGTFLKSFDMKANDSGYCDDIYQQILDYLNKKNCPIIKSSEGDIAFFENNRLFRISFNNYKYSHFGLHVISD